MFLAKDRERAAFRSVSDAGGCGRRGMARYLTVIFCGVLAMSTAPTHSGRCILDPAGVSTKIPMHPPAAPPIRGSSRPATNSGSISFPGAGTIGSSSPPPNPQIVGLYITACADGAATSNRKLAAVSSIERRLSALSWHYRQLGERLDRGNRHIATVLDGIRNTQGRPPVPKEAILPEDLIAMLETLDRGTLRGLRDRAMLLLGFAGGLRRSDVVGLDVADDQTENGRGWIELLEPGVVLTLRGKTAGATLRSDAGRPIAGVL